MESPREHPNNWCEDWGSSVTVGSRTAQQVDGTSAKGEQRHEPCAATTQPLWSKKGRRHKGGQQINMTIAH